MKVAEKIKKSISSKVEVKKPKVEVKQVEVKKVEKSKKPISTRKMLNEYHVETGSNGDIAIQFILEQNAKNIPVTMKEVAKVVGDTQYQAFCRLEERGLAYREGKFLFIKKIGKQTSKILSVVKSRIGCCDYIKDEERNKINKIKKEITV